MLVPFTEIGVIKRRGNWRTKMVLYYGSTGPSKVENTGLQTMGAGVKDAGANAGRLLKLQAFKLFLSLLC